MVLKIRFDQYEFARYDYGRTIAFKIYEEDGITQFDATADSLDTIVIKSFKRHGDRAFFFRDVARALSVLGIMAQMIEDVPAVWTTQNIGEGTFAWTETLRPSIPGYLWLEAQLSDTPKTKQVSTELIRTFVQASESA